MVDHAKKVSAEFSIMGQVTPDQLQQAATRVSNQSYVKSKLCLEAVYD